MSRPLVYAALLWVRLISNCARGVAPLEPLATVQGEVQRVSDDHVDPLHVFLFHLKAVAA